MNVNKLLVCLLLSLPFIGVFTMAWSNMSFKVALGIFVMAVAIVLTVTVGVALIHG